MSAAKTSVVRGQKIAAPPGDDLHVMVRDHADEDGRVWPAGTEYRPVCAGASPCGYYQIVAIGGERQVTFRRALASRSRA